MMERGRENLLRETCRVAVRCMHVWTLADKVSPAVLGNPAAEIISGRVSLSLLYALRETFGLSYHSTSHFATLRIRSD